MVHFDPIVLIALPVMFVVCMAAAYIGNVLHDRAEEREAWREGTIRELAKERAHVARQYVETSYARRTR